MYFKIQNMLFCGWTELFLVKILRKTLHVSPKIVNIVHDPTV
jgi:hypothetical protein